MSETRRSPAEIQAEIEKLQIELEEAVNFESAREAIRASVDKFCAEFKVSLKDFPSLVGKFASDTRKPGKNKSQKRPARYRHPHDASKTWSGFGRRPAWVINFETAGQMDQITVSDAK